MINPQYRQREMSQADLDAIHEARTGEKRINGRRVKKEEPSKPDSPYDVQEASWLRAIGEGAAEGLLPDWLRMGVKGAWNLVSNPFKEHLEDKLKEWHSEGKTDSEIKTLMKEWQKNHRQKVYTYSNGKSFVKNLAKFGTMGLRNFGMNYGLNAWDAYKSGQRSKAIEDAVRSRLNIGANDKLDINKYTILGDNNNKYLLRDLIKGTPESDRRALDFVSMITQGPLSGARKFYNIHKNVAGTSKVLDLLKDSSRVVATHIPFSTLGSGYHRRKHKKSSKKRTKRSRR